MDLLNITRRAISSVCTLSELQWSNGILQGWSPFCKRLKLYRANDTNNYPTGIKNSKSEMVALDIGRECFHDARAYTLLMAAGNLLVNS